MATKRYQRDFKELEARRRRGMRLLARGVAQAEVARSCAISRQSVSRWAQMVADAPQAWRRRPLGRPGAMSAAERAKLSKMLVAGALANGALASSSNANLATPSARCMSGGSFAHWVSPASGPPGGRSNATKRRS